MAPRGNFSLASWLPAAALGLAAACASASPAFAQGTPSGPRSLGNLHVGDDPTPTTDGARRFLDAARAGRAQGECPRAKFIVIVKKGADPFQAALAQARRDALLALLGDRARYFFVDFNVDGAADEVRVEYDVARDQEFPKLDVIWDPPPGTKVRESTRIRARATASDDWNRWQSGVRRIDLDVLPDNGSFGFHEWPARPLTCEDVPPPRTLDGVHVVPSPAPPIVRLRARAVDHAGHRSVHVRIAEYPTGDFYGTFEIETAGRYRTRADIALNHDGRGNLTGTMVGEQRVDARINECVFRTIRPNRFRVSLVGAYTEGRSLTVFIKEIEESKLRELRACPSGSHEIEWGFKTHIWPPEQLLGTSSPLVEVEVRPDGTRLYKLDHGPTTATVTLRRARD